jgi:hypothetical protein
MEVHTALVLTVQLVALFSIAGALLLYLLCKVKGSRNVTLDPRCGSILITSADTALGLQLSTYLASKGCRVFAGMKVKIFVTFSRLHSSILFANLGSCRFTPRQITKRMDEGT